MKKGCLLLIGMLMLVGCGPSGGEDNSLTNDSSNSPVSISQNVQNKESEGLEFDLSDDGKSYIMYNVGECKDATVVIPSTYKNLPVTSIGQKAFMCCETVSSVVIPNTITEIGTGAFYGCESLTSIDIPEGVLSIGEMAFYRCTSLTSISIPNSIKYIDDFIIENCDSLKYTEYGNCLYLGNKENPYLLLASAKDTSITEATIARGTKILLYGAFNGCKSLTSIDIPEGVIDIGSWAFNDCELITSISIPNGVETIGYCAFGDCRALRSLSISNSVTKIESYAIQYCTSLTSIVIPSSITTFKINGINNCDALTIYCEASSKPVDWSDDWNCDERPVYWGGQWSYVNGIPTPNN